MAHFLLAVASPFDAAFSTPSLCQATASLRFPEREHVAVGTDCTGIGTPILALKNLKVDFVHEFASDIDEGARKMIKANLNPKILFGDVEKRDNKTAPDCDLYIAGFPCQPFSDAGLHQGVEDEKGRGKVIEHI